MRRLLTSRNLVRMLVTFVAVGSGTVSIVTLKSPLKFVILPAGGVIIALLAVSWLLERRPVRHFARMDFLPRCPYAIEPATEDDIRWIAGLARQVYHGSDVIPLPLMLEWYRANPTGFSIIKDRQGHRCGNIDILPLRPLTLSRLIAGEMIELEIRGDSIFPAQERSQIKNLYVESFVAVTQNYKGNPIAAYRGIMNTPALIERICDPDPAGRVYAIGASSAGTRLLEDLGFDQVGDAHSRRDHHSLYVVQFGNLTQNLSAYAEGTDRQRFMTLVGKLDQSPTL